MVVLDVEVLEELVNSKDQFITFLQDEIAELKALLREDKPERVIKEVDFKSNRGYKPVYSRIREQVLANKKKHGSVRAEEEYEKVTVNE